MSGVRLSGYSADCGSSLPLKSAVKQCDPLLSGWPEVTGFTTSTGNIVYVESQQRSGKPGSDLDRRFA